jgi:probable nitrogen fixation protein
MNTIEPTVAGTEGVLPPEPFLEALASLIRAEDAEGGRPEATAADRLRTFILTKEARRAIPIIGDPDPETLHKVELFYRAVAQLVEKRTGLAVPWMMKMSHEGFGRVVLTTGRLVVFAKSLRDVHRFGYETFEALALEGEKAVAQALRTIAAYPAVARV